MIIVVEFLNKVLTYREASGVHGFKSMSFKPIKHTVDGIYDV